jgi:hypothetical protein
MTVKLEKNAGDELLKILGKKRAYKMPTGNNEKLGPYVHVKAYGENIIKALLRTKGQEPPDGWFFLPDDMDND